MFSGHYGNKSNFSNEKYLISFLNIQYHTLLHLQGIYK